MPDMIPFLLFIMSAFTSLSYPASRVEDITWLNGRRNKEEILKRLGRVERFLTLFVFPTSRVQTGQNMVGQGKDDGHLVKEHKKIINAFFIFFHFSKGLCFYRDIHLGLRVPFYQKALLTLDREDSQDRDLGRKNL